MFDKSRAKSCSECKITTWILLIYFLKFCNNCETKKPKRHQYSDITADIKWIPCIFMMQMAFMEPTNQKSMRSVLNKKSFILRRGVNDKIQSAGWAILPLIINLQTQQAEHKVPTVTTSPFRAAIIKRPLSNTEGPSSNHRLPHKSPDGAEMNRMWANVMKRGWRSRQSVELDHSVVT